jgi:hypothetical protein
MFRLARFCRRFLWVPATFTAWLLIVGAAVAAAAREEPPKPTENNWVLAYIIVLLGIALGLVILCRPGRRSKELPKEKE